MVVLPCHRVGAHAFSFLKILPLRSWLFYVRAMMSEIVSGNNHVHIGDIFAGGGGWKRCVNQNSIWKRTLTAQTLVRHEVRPTS